MTSPTDAATARRAPRLLRLLSRTLVAATAGSVLLLGAPGGGQLATPGPPAAEGAVAESGIALAGHDWRTKPGKRRIVRYTVRRGDTATGLAVRFHAWTRELRRINHLGRRDRVLVGQRLRIPVVAAAAPARREVRKPARGRARPQARRDRVRRDARPWRGIDASRAQVRRVIVRTARRHDIDPRTVLAISWQESGWQQYRRSPATAIGAMQVLPGTGRWMSLYAGRRLNIYALRDNVLAGVLLYRVLRRQTTWMRSVAAYYQGLGALQRHGLYRETRRYVRNVRALHRQLGRGWNPA